MTKFDETISIAGQITVADVQRLADAGFKGLICNRPDNEDYIQTNFADIAAAAKTAGIEAHYVPMSHGGLTMEDIEDFDRARKAIGDPVLAYCHSGARTSSMWALHQATTGANVQGILATAASAGFNMGHMSGILTSLSANAK
jgi:sulfide:quinone oxidoreductase